MKSTFVFLYYLVVWMAFILLANITRNSCISILYIPCGSWHFISKLYFSGIKGSSVVVLTIHHHLRRQWKSRWKIAWLAGRTYIWSGFLILRDKCITGLSAFWNICEKCILVYIVYFRWYWMHAKFPSY